MIALAAEIFSTAQKKESCALRTKKKKNTFASIGGNIQEEERRRSFYDCVSDLSR